MKRVDHDQPTFKLDDQKGVMEEDLIAFDGVALLHKLVFVVNEHLGVRCCRRIHCPRGSKLIQASCRPFRANRSFNVTEYINSCFCSR